MWPKGESEATKKKTIPNHKVGSSNAHGVKKFMYKMCSIWSPGRKDDLICCGYESMSEPNYPAPELSIGGLQFYFKSS